MKATKNIDGTTFQGFVDVSYNRLVSVFGEPHYRNGDKTTVEWNFEVGNTVFTIYDYKWSSRQNDIVESFHIGGKSYAVAEMVKRLIYP